MRSHLFDHHDTLVTTGSPARQELAMPLRILVWNIYKARRRRWRNDFLSLIPDKNLVLLQESVLNAVHDDIFGKEKSFEWVMARSHQSRRTNTFTGVKTGAAAPSLKQAFLSSPDQEPVSKTPKMLLATLYPVAESEKNLLALNMHALNFVSLEKYKRHLDQIAEMLRGHDGPVILGGDFNTWNAARLRHFYQLMEQSGLQEVSLSRPRRLRHFNRHLDHIFYRDLRLENAEVLNGINSSDHHPITATFSPK
jgi:endonuclease/exonuclease/phosphatase (EEP) superfamily protein YafD